MTTNHNHTSHYPRTKNAHIRRLDDHLLAAALALHPHNVRGAAQLGDGILAGRTAVVQLPLGKLVAQNVLVLVHPVRFAVHTELGMAVRTAAAATFRCGRHEAFLALWAASEVRTERVGSFAHQTLQAGERFGVQHFGQRQAQRFHVRCVGRNVGGQVGQLVQWTHNVPAFVGNLSRGDCVCCSCRSQCIHLTLNYPVCAFLTLLLQYFWVHLKQTNEEGVPTPLSDAEMHDSQSNTNFSSSRTSSKHTEQAESASSPDPSTLVVFEDILSVCFVYAAIRTDWYVEIQLIRLFLVWQ